MSFSVNPPPSTIVRLAKSAENEEGEESGQKKREDWKKLKELEEARKAGTAPAMQDEEGKDINPHIPQYIMQAPWYFGATTPTLRHQRPQEEKHPLYSGMDQWFKKGVKEGPVATKYRKGACENCGAVTHKKKDCLERPRKVGAKFTGSEIAPDEHIQPKLLMDFDGKRDRWNGYNIDDHKKFFEEFAKIEEAKRQLKAQRLETDVLQGSSEAATEKTNKEGDEDDEDKYAEEMDMPGQKFETKQRITVRNLRIREDTAKYLYNLDPNSAYYDPKTRSMRQNPFADTGKDAEDLTYAGDNFVRWSGDAHQMAVRQTFAWEAYEKGTEVHLQADPTKLDMLAREYSKRKEDYKKGLKDSVLDKYGGQEHLEAPPKQLLLASTEDYVEYSRHGTILKGQEKAVVKSRYEEDVLINNHTTVWGSFWKEGQWGFKCCHSFIKGSYCTGSAGQAATETQVVAVKDKAVDIPALSVALVHTEQRTQSSEEETELVEKSSKKNKSKRKKEKKKRRKEKSRRKKKKRRKSSSSESDSSDSDSEDEEAAKERRIKEAMRKEEARIKEVDRVMALDERKRPYNSMYDVSEPTEEEIEAFRRKQYHHEDPMAQFM